MGDVNSQTKEFIKRIENVVHRCFKKIKIKERKDEEKEALFKRWKKLKNDADENNKSELRNIEKHFLINMLKSISRK